MNDIQYIYQMLNKKSAPKIQEEGFALANTIDDLSLLIMPPAPLLYGKVVHKFCLKNQMKF